MRRVCRTRWRGSDFTINTLLELPTRTFQEIVMKYQPATEKMAAYRQQIADIRQQKKRARQPLFA